MSDAKTSSMELLAPAGNMAAFAAAMEAGADAVYVGAPGLNARALSRDFTFDEIAGMVAYTKSHGKKLYVAMNSLMKESEVRLALESLQRFVMIAPDALILQDMGLLALVQRYCPQLPVHASTLMTANTTLGAACFQRMGFVRVVLGREVSLAEIKAIHQNTKVELEIFVHGAMCFSYSGLCRFSSLHGGKSSLRGQCVQPCRRRYDWVASGKSGGRDQGSRRGGYFFSMNDLCGIEQLAQLRDAGALSLKIEGRLKPAEYVYNVTRAYRLALDALDAPPERQKQVLHEAHQFLDAAMARKRSTGFFLPGREQQLIQPALSGTSGEAVGKVEKIERGKIPPMRNSLVLQVSLLASLKVGDRLRFLEERSGDRKSFTLHALEVKGRRVDRAGKGQRVTVVVPEVDTREFQRPSRGMLFRMGTGGRSTQAAHSTKSIRVNTVSAPECKEQVVDQQLAELGFSTGKNGELGSLGSMNKKNGGPEWWLRATSLDAARLRMPFSVSHILLELTQPNLELALQPRNRTHPVWEKVIWALPPLLREEDTPALQRAVQQLCGIGMSRFQLAHISQQAFFGASGSAMDGDLELYGDYSVNALNSPALTAYRDAGLRGVQFCLETDRDSLVEVLTHLRRLQLSSAVEPLRVGLYVYGRPPLFTARLHAPHFQGQRSFASERGERFFIDRKPEAVYAFAHTPFSLLEYVDEFTRLGLDYLVVDITHGAPKRESSAVTALLHGRGELPEVMAGNYGGVLS